MLMIELDTKLERFAHSSCFCTQDRIINLLHRGFYVLVLRSVSENSQSAERIQAFFDEITAASKQAGLMSLLAMLNES